MNYGEAVALVEAAVAAEDRGLYERATEEYFPSPKIQQLLALKAQQVERWGVALAAWLADGQRGPKPMRM
ncbi:hypothetical protein SPRG_06887 [Saprolegnia parasitica CBS 223.65]|uniref:Uncharacterized protein n=1 Tax=Saprolegnia parasitica (strain CBS 223.65) TaxID=695850 RepID=A0A067CLD8_SAPPC|nr:hypothetical protein SPRG_06887 [Saprolegnia parasitica CBS 223.65]KDO27617.1 hypothetical protein SPRG_06887 [Saprolegnia parasitica CBS 223.65]|eukprot:XP_012201739.1 hypothetical protein SPRG_06887 [Saprolegnia parasitica CBS 223.65]